MQAAGYLVAALAELRAGVQDRHHDFDCRKFLFRVDVDRNAASVILHRARPVLKQDDANVAGISGQRLVDGVVDGLVHELMETALRRVTDIHARALAHGFKPP